MREFIQKCGATVAIFVAGALFGSHALYVNLRVNGLEQRQAAFEQNVEQFAKQVSEKLNPQPKPATPPPAQLPVDPAKK